MPLRICQLITELRPAGAERCVYELATRLDRREFDVRVIALRGGSVADDLRAAGVEAAVLGMRTKRDLHRLAALPGLLRRWRVDLLHTHLFHADLVGRPAARLAGVGHLVHTVHVAEGRWRPWHFAWARLARGWCDRIVCVSAGVRDFHARRSGLPPNAYEVIPNGVDVDAFAHNPEARRQLRAEWGLQDRDVLLACIARLDVQKGIDVLLHALANAPALRAGALLPEHHLVVAGEGAQRGLLESMLAKDRSLSARVRLLGYRRDVAAILSAADVAVVPSRWEGFGLAAAEAMAAGLPVVATRVAGLTEVVAHDRTGLLVAPDDPAALASAIGHLVGSADLRHRLGQAGLQRARESFSIAANVRAHEAIYRIFSSPQGDHPINR